MVIFEIANQRNPNSRVGPPRRWRFRDWQQVVPARERCANPQAEPGAGRCGGGRSVPGLLARAIVLGWLFVAAAAVVGRAESAEAPAGVMTLSSGSTIPGTFRPSDSSDFVRWQGTAFTEPFEFETPAISSVRFPAAEQPAEPQGEFALELAGGDILTGRFAGWSEESVRFESAHFGTLSIRPAAIRRLYRIDENPMLVFANLSGLTDWETTSGVWREDGPHVWTDTDGAMLTGDLAVPDRAVIEFELSWSKSPNFAFSIGIDPENADDDGEQGWRFEAWNDVIAAVREQPEIADVAPIQELSEETKRLHLLVYLDQTAGEMQIFHPDGALVGRISVRPETPEDDAQKMTDSTRGVRLINRQGTTRLERLRIARWNGVLPTSDDDAPSRFELADGSVVSGETVRLSEDAQQFLIKNGDDQQSIAAKDVVTAELSPGSEPQSSAASALLQDSTRVSGSIREIREDKMVLVNPEIIEPLVVPLLELRSLVVSAEPSAETTKAPSGRRGRLEIAGHKLAGRLVAGSERPDASCLVWHPIGSRTSSPLWPEASGRIVYRDPPPSDSNASPKAANGDNIVIGFGFGAVQAQQQPQPGFFAKLFLKKADEPRAVATETGPQNLHLRSGDVIACTITSINESGISIETPETDARIVPHDRVKAVELIGSASPPDLQKVKKSRLLTLPRLQAASPPTHLLCSRTGDFLRCRLLAMTEEHVRVEVQLEEVDIPRSRVAQIIWFHPDELDAEAGETSAESAPGDSPSSAATGDATGEATDELDAAAVGGIADGAASVVSETDPAAGSSATDYSRLAQVLRPGGKRVTFDPEEVDGVAISGVSEVLGACRFPLKEVDQVLFGEEISSAASELTYQQWRLHPAVLPRIAQDLGEEAGDSGKVSPLVGQPAPDFQLDLLGGGRFKLSDEQGHIVVLDFWATWCGPCMQTMPLLEEAMQEFDPAQVRLVSVNLEERPDHVKDVLERHELDLTVALDIDGVAARRYEANAIPQLVIVDKAGRVARLFVGGGPNVIEQLKTSLNELLKP